MNIHSGKIDIQTAASSSFLQIRPWMEWTDLGGGQVNRKFLLAVTSALSLNMVRTAQSGIVVSASQLVQVLSAFDLEMSFLRAKA